MPPTINPDNELSIEVVGDKGEDFTVFSVKPGRGPSAMGAVGGVIFVAFSLLMTVFLCAFAYGFSKVLVSVVGEDIGVLRYLPFIFPLVGLLFVAVGVVSIVYSLYNVASPNRLSEVEITTGSEESDPLNQVFAAAVPATNDSSDESVEERLARLDELRGKGMVSETEYASQRERILSDL